MDKKIRQEKERWERTTLAGWLEKSGEREPEFTTYSGLGVNRIYTPLDVSGLDYARDLGFPGEYPFTRGAYPTMYRGRIWSYRQLSGHGSAEEQNQLFKAMLAAGETGISLICDPGSNAMLEPDDPLVEAMAGATAFPAYSLEEVETALDGIDIEKNYLQLGGRSLYVTACLLAIAEKRGIPFERLAGNTPNDFWAATIICGRNDTFLSMRTHLRMTGDLVEFVLKNIPKWNPVNFDVYPVREVSGTAPQELAAAMAVGIMVIDYLKERGLDIEEVLRRLSFHLAIHKDLFEEIAKLRAARRMWARIVKEKYGVENEEAIRRSLRIHIESSSTLMTYHEPLNNIIRGTLACLAAALGGVQAVHLSTYDDGIAPASEQGLKMGLRTQQIVAYESGVTNVVDPLGGSYFIEALTSQVEREAQKELERIEGWGGMLKALESGAIIDFYARKNLEQQARISKGEIPIVGVNRFILEEKEEEVLGVRPYQPDRDEWKRLIARIKELKKRRDNGKVAEALEGLRRACRSGENIILPLVNAVKAYATVGEVGKVYREEFGVWESKKRGLD